MGAHRAAKEVLAKVNKNMRPIAEHFSDREYEKHHMPPRSTKRRNAANKARNRDANLAARRDANQSPKGVWNGAINGTPIVLGGKPK